MRLLISYSHGVYEVVNYCSHHGVYEAINYSHGVYEAVRCMRLLISYIVMECMRLLTIVVIMECTCMMLSTMHHGVYEVVN